MARLRPTERTLKLLTETTKRQHVCRACRAQQTRFFASTPSHAEDERKWTQRLKETLFGDKPNEEQQKREVEASERTKDKARQYDPQNPYETRKAADVEGNYRVAPVINPEVNEDYVAATDWDGLQMVGTRQWIKNVQDNGEVYNGYAPKKNLQLADGQWSSLLHNIAVELLLLQGARQSSDAIWLGGRKLTFDRTKLFEIRPTATGADLTAPSDGDVQETLLAELTRLRTRRTVGPKVTIKSIPQLSTTTVLPWMAMRLHDMNTKLAISKRVMQLTGRRITDPVLSNATTIEDLFVHLKSKDRPQKLAQSEEFRQMNTGLLNVKIHQRRPKLIQREKQVGRWKLIEAELTARGLPLTGTNHPREKSVIEPILTRQGRRMRRLKRAPTDLE